MILPTGAPDEARAYQAFLLDALGDDDPAAVQSGALNGWRAIVDEAGPNLRVRPEPDGWSALECLGHAVDAEIVMSARYRWVLAEHEPVLLGYDQDAWSGALRHVDADPQGLLALLGALRAANLRLWRAAGPEARARVGRHAERGPESLDLMFRMLAGHDRVHQAQARRAIERARTGGGETPAEGASR